MGKKTDFILNAITLGGRTRKNNRQAAMSAAVINHTPTETTTMLTNNFDNMELSQLASSLNDLAKDVSEEVNEFSNIQAAVKELNNNLTLIKNQAAIVKFSADLCYVDAVTLGVIEEKSKEVGIVLNNYNLNPNLGTFNELKKLKNEMQDMFESYNAARIEHINKAITKSTQLEKAIKGSSKLKTSSSVSKAKNDTLGAHLSTIATEIKKDAKNVVTDLEFLTEQINKFNEIYLSVSKFITELKKKDIAVETADRKMTQLVSSMISATGAIINHSDKHADAMLTYDRAVKKYNDHVDRYTANAPQKIPN